jgi:hypothetical protein
VRTPAGRLLVQAVRGTIQQPEILPLETAVEDDVVVIIGRGFSAENLQRSLQAFSAAAIR